MSLNATPRGDRIHIALFGKRNAGKSSVISRAPLVSVVRLAAHVS